MARLVDAAAWLLAVGTGQALIATTAFAGRAQYNGGGQILMESRPRQVARGEFVNAVAIFVRHPQVTAPVESDRFKMLKRVQADSNNWIDIVVSGGQAGNLRLGIFENFTGATITVGGNSL